MKRFGLTLDLKSDAELITQYEEYHKKIPFPIEKSIRDAGIVRLDIYRYETRLFMLIEADDNFDFSTKAEMDANNQDVQAWEALMWKFQKPLENAPAGEKWQVMKQIFEL